MRTLSMPERIWVPLIHSEGELKELTAHVEGDVEYVRADVAASRHAEEMREAHRAGMKFGMECSITGAYVPADGGDAAFAAFLASQKEGKG